MTIVAGTYRFSDITVASDVPLTELPEATQRADVRVTHRPPAPFHAPPSFTQWTAPDGTIWLAFGEDAFGYVLSFGTLAQFHVSRDGAEVVVAPGDGTPPDTTRHLLLNQVLPLVLVRRGRLVLHAAAVSWHGRVAAFIGRSGAGKSMLAAACAMAGARIVTDDCLVVQAGRADGEWLAVPCDAGIRLWPDAIARMGWEPSPSSGMAHYTDKRRVGTAHAPVAFERTTLPLSRIFHLTQSPEASDGDVRGQRAVMTIAAELFRLDVRDTHEGRTQFDAIVGLASAIPVSVLDRRSMAENQRRVMQALGG